MRCACRCLAAGGSAGGRACGCDWAGTGRLHAGAGAGAGAQFGVRRGACQAQLLLALGADGLPAYLLQGVDVAKGKRNAGAGVQVQGLGCKV